MGLFRCKQTKLKSLVDISVEMMFFLRFMLLGSNCYLVLLLAICFILLIFWRFALIIKQASPEQCF